MSVNCIVECVCFWLLMTGVPAKAFEPTVSASNSNSVHLRDHKVFDWKPQDGNTTSCQAPTDYAIDRVAGRTENRARTSTAKGGAPAKGTGDTIVQAQIGSHADDNSRWAMECHDGEAVIGFQDYGYISLSTMWCKFMFPKKKMNGGYYPYYDYCNVRDVQVMKEYYCYDKYYPVETYDTFVTGYVYASGYTVHAGSIYPALYASNAESYKCCKLPHGYHLDYSRCQYHYSHDKFGEHYGDANMFVMRCDRDFLMTGIGKAETPWDDYMRYVWVQCCPLFYDTAYVPLWATANATLHARAQRRHYSSPSSYGSHGRTDEQPTKIINVS